MHEWDQPHFTFNNGHCRSKIDRMYCNQHISFQFDRQCSTSALEWETCKNPCSSHRPISFCRYTPPPKDPNQKPIPDYVYNEADWKDKVRREYEYMIRAEPNSNNVNPIRKLIVLKQAIRTVSEEYRNAERGELEEDATPEDKLGLDRKSVV